VPGRREPGDLRDAGLQAVLGESQRRAALPRAGHLRESETGAILNQSVRNLLSEGLKTFRKGDGGWLCSLLSAVKTLAGPSVPVLGTAQRDGGASCGSPGPFSCGHARGWGPEVPGRAVAEVGAGELTLFPHLSQQQLPPRRPELCRGPPRTPEAAVPP